MDLICDNLKVWSNRLDICDDWDSWVKTAWEFGYIPRILCTYYGSN